MEQKGQKILCVLLALALVVSCSYLIYDKCFDHKERQKVTLGVENVESNLELVEGKRVGLITNATGVDSNFESTIDILNDAVELTTLFAPEHGIRGAEDAGDTVENGIDSKTGLPIYSLYGDTKQPTPEMLENVDILVYDIQDVGARFYTYISTMYYGMKAAAEKGIPFVVLDRPNPVSGNQVQGCVLEPDFESFVGITEIPQRYGLTCGELAEYMNVEDAIGCDLQVIQMKSWDRDMYYEDTGLPCWVMPSPNLPTPDTAAVYSGTCLFEGTNVSEGRGTTRPFEMIGAPWIDGQQLADAMNAMSLDGIFFRAVSFTPTASKYENEVCQGVELQVIDRDKFDSVKTGVGLLYIIRDLYSDDFAYLETNSIDRLTGGSYIREGTYSLDELYQMFDDSSSQFQQKASAYYLY